MSLTMLHSICDNAIVADLDIHLERQWCCRKSHLRIFILFRPNKSDNAIVALSLLRQWRCRFGIEPESVVVVHFHTIVGLVRKLKQMHVLCHKELYLPAMLCLGHPAMINMRLIPRNCAELCVVLEIIRRRTIVLNSLVDMIPTQLRHLRELVNVSDEDCKDAFMMDRVAFARLCSLLHTLGGLRNSKYIFVQEKVAMSGHTVSKYFHHVLQSVLKLHSLFLVQPKPVPEDSTYPRWQDFKVGYVNSLNLNRTCDPAYDQKPAEYQVEGKLEYAEQNKRSRSQKSNISVGGSPNVHTWTNESSTTSKSCNELGLAQEGVFCNPVVSWDSQKEGSNPVGSNLELSWNSYSRGCCKVSLDTLNQTSCRLEEISLLSTLNQASTVSCITWSIVSCTAGQSQLHQLVKVSCSASL
ncbi:hypothetical protein ACS0TY_011312 [Phlomoides rotata]